MYKHGAYADIADSKTEVILKALGTIPVYFGTSPVGQISAFDSVNEPVLIESFSDAVKHIGYCENFEKYSLCEVISAHFKNSVNPIAPIVVINSLDPTKHKETAQKKIEIEFINNIASFEDDAIILSSFSIEGKTLDEDYFISLDADGKTVTITAKDTLLKAMCAYTKIDVKMHTSKDIVNSITKVLPLVYQKLNLIPSILAAPGFSDRKDVNDALVLSSQKINGHWYAWVNSDLPATKDTEDIDKAIAFKKQNNFNSPLQMVCYPMAKKDGRLYHMSTLATVSMQRVDSKNNGIPYEEPSNKSIAIDCLCLSDGTAIDFDITAANQLNAKGITTSAFWGGKWVLWGVNTAAYEDNLDIDPKNIFCSSVRMIQYIANEFQRRYGLVIDKPMNRSLKDTILNDSGEFLDTLTAQGALLGGEVFFSQTSNNESDIVTGDFIFDIETTTTPPAKSITFKIAYTSKWQSSLFE